MMRWLKNLFCRGEGPYDQTPARLKGCPYNDEAVALIYELLFCDRPDLFKSNIEGPLDPPWSVLFQEPPDLDAIARIAHDESAESRTRQLAFTTLRKASREVPARILLGTIIEVGLRRGLDTLAVYADGGVRYINHGGSMIVVEGKVPAFEFEVERIIELSQPVVDAIGPWEGERLAAPRNGHVRLTFLVSDGLYFGEGPMKAMERDHLAAPLIAASTNLLVSLTDKSRQDSAHRP